MRVVNLKTKKMKFLKAQKKRKTKIQKSSNQLKNSHKPKQKDSNLRSKLP